MIKEPLPSNGGGNFRSDPCVSVRRNLAIGDCVASLCVVDKLVEQGVRVEFQANPAIHCVLRRHGRIQRIIEPNGFCHINLDGVYENHPQRRTRSFSDLFIESANNQLRTMGVSLGEPKNCTPRLIVSPVVKEATRKQLEKYPKPWTFICPRSHNYFCRTVPDPTWSSAARGIHGTKFWIGLHPAPDGIVDLKATHFDNIINYLSVADLLLSVDTGPMHVAAALGTPVVAIGQSSSPELHLSDQRDYAVLWPEGLECLNCQKNSCPIDYYNPPCQKIDPARITDAANKRLSRKESVSAIISVYRPEPDVFTKCIACVLPQVDEVIVCRDLAGAFPTNAPQHPKIKYVVKNQSAIGYGRKQNYASRHSSGKYLLLMNDDVFLDPNAVARMVEQMSIHRVGVVSNLLRYGDGTIYHAGKIRQPGVKGWMHIDYKQRHHSFITPVELENCCGACVLVRRAAHYDVLGFDEDFYLYAEDDDYALKMRKNGWKIMFTPHSTGVHLEHQSTQKTANIGTLVANANATFTKKWGRYLEHNLNTIPGNFNYA